MRRRIRTSRWIAVFCLVMMLAPQIALALTTISVQYDHVPSGWSVEENDQGMYLLSIELQQETAEGVPEYHASVYVSQDTLHYATLDEFLQSWDAPTVDQNAGDSPFTEGSQNIASINQFTGTDSGTTQVKGQDAYFTSSTTVETPDGFSEPWQTTRSTTYWVDLGDSSVIIYLSVDVWRGYEDQLDPLWAQVQDTFAAMTFDWGGGSVVPGTSGSGLPWQTALGGLIAVVAAATAIAGAAASTAAKTGQKQDPNRPIGYVLQLSTPRISLKSDVSTPLSVTVHEVYPDGHFQMASSARIQITAPAGVGVQPASGSGTVQAMVWQTGAIGAGSSIQIQAVAALGTRNASVSIAPQEETRLEVTLDPNEARELFANGRDSVTVAAVVALSLRDLADPGIDPNVVKSSIKFASGSEWLDLSQATDWDEGRAIKVEASQPDPTTPVQPPESAVINVTAQVGTRSLTGSINIPLARFPVIDAAPDTVELGADTGETGEVKVWIEHAAGLEWSFGTQWKDSGPHVAYTEVEQTNPTMCVIRLAEDSVGKLDPALPEQAFTLIVRASAANMDDLERHIKVVIAQEGIFVDRVGRHPDGTFHIDATGEAKPTEIDLRVFVRDEAGTITPQPQLAQQAEWTPAGDASSAGHTVLGFKEFECRFKDMRGVENPSATFECVMRRELPTAGKPIKGQLQVTIPAHDEPHFTKLVNVQLLGVDTSPYSESWNVEYERCMHVINKYVPLEHRAKLTRLVGERGKTMGTEGLYELRHRIYDFANTLMMKQVADYLDEAWWNEQVEGFLDWVSWCGDIAFAVASGRIVGTAAGIALGMLKPMLVSAVDAWINGKSIDEWAWEQVGVVGLVIEGQWTDVDFLTKITGNRRALAWAICISYHFVRNLDRGLSVTDAMIATAQMVRDELLVTFLRGHAGTRPQDVPDVDSARTKRPTGDADSLDAKKPAGGGEDGPDAARKGADGETGPNARARGRETAERIRKNTTRRDGKDYVDADTALEVMRDPDAAREMRRNNPEAYEAYTNTRAEMQKQHDTRLINELKSRPEFRDKNIRVETVGTEGGIDRDYRVMQEVPDPRNPGQTMEIEVSSSKWVDDSHRIFSEQTGGPTDPKGAAEHAHRHQQVATDGYHAEAATDMSDQAWRTDPETGQRTRIQVEPQVELVKRGEGTLHNPDELGRTYANKVTESSAGGELDGYTQAAKASRELKAVRSGYESQGYDVGKLSPDLKQGMNTIERCARGDITPGEANRTLAQNKLGDLNSMANKLSSQFSALGQARKR